MTRAEINEHIVSLLLKAFPEETIKYGQRFRKSQVETLNAAVVSAKYERAQESGYTTGWPAYDALRASLNDLSKTEGEN